MCAQKLLVAAGAALGMAMPVAAGDSRPPPWRGTAGSTFQMWQFLTPDIGPTAASNPFGQPQFNPDGAQWLPNPPGSGPTSGVWCIQPGTPGLTFTIPNRFDPTMQKEVYVQLKYFSPGGTPPTVDAFDPAGIFGIPDWDGTVSTPVSTPIPGQSYWETSICLPICPQFELVRISTPGPTIYIDQVVIDTRCFPTPGTAGLLLASLGAAGARRRRR